MTFLSPTEETAATTFLTRFQGAADALGIDVGHIVAGASHLGASLAGYTRVSVTDTFSRLALLAAWPRDSVTDAELRDYHRALGNQIQGMTLPALLQRPARSRFVELESVETARNEKEVTVLLHLVGDRDLDADLDALMTATIFQDSAAAEIRGAAETLGVATPLILVDRALPRGANLWSFRFPMANGTAAERDQTMERTLTLMGRLGVAANQKLAFERLHAALAREDQCVVSVVSAFDKLLPFVRVGYADLPWETAVPTMIDLYPNANAEDKLGALAGAFEAATAHAFELIFRDEEPLRARVSVQGTVR